MEPNRWDETIASLAEFDENGVAAAAPLAELIGWARPGWAGKVNVHTSMHRLQFTNYVDSYPWPSLVQVEWKDGVFTVVLGRDWERECVASDRCREGAIHDVLEAFLHQLLAEQGRMRPSQKPARGRTGTPRP